MGRLVREELSKCYYREGVNHLEKCGSLREKYLQMLKDHRLHAEGKTDEAKADLARLRLIREKREADAARKQAEKEEKEALERERQREREVKEAKKREAALGKPAKKGKK
ncbi:hypothetical protein NUW58_g2643 [Xylaria curta]|uniref:Uncharacterized protein n=1 Tax=Xylaria curta TaxID=42375 RepID=A0ACC1PFS2_9PEZI|nr:hypothetical protein NUW58_g2643 [Xylaria curta]